MNAIDRELTFSITLPNVRFRRRSEQCAVVPMFKQLVP